MTSSTGVTIAAVAAAINATVTAAVDVSSTESSPSVIQAPSEPIFLQTKLAQGIAGTFVWAALFVTCQQVIFGVEILELLPSLCKSFIPVRTLK